MCCATEPGDMTFPCPSAPKGWGRGICQSVAKVVDCTDAPEEGGLEPTPKPTPVPTPEPTPVPMPLPTPADLPKCAVDAWVQCPGSENWCHGQLCCPHAEGGPSFP